MQNYTHRMKKYQEIYDIKEEKKCKYTAVQILKGWKIKLGERMYLVNGKRSFCLQFSACGSVEDIQYMV